MMRSRQLSLAVVTAALIALVPAIALGASFTVSPIQVYLSAKQTSAIVTVRNDSDESMRFQLTAMKWDQSETGEMQLTPTTDVVFFPRLLTIPRGGERNVRVGVVVPFGATEKTYRLFIEELPPTSDTAGGAQNSVRMRTRMGIPIFAMPTTGRAGAAITDLRVENGRVVLRLENRGTSHVIPEMIRVTGRTREGGAAFEKTINSWYVLAGRSQRFEVTLSDRECRGAASVSADVRIGELINLTQTASVTAASCGPSGAQ